jgi:hypothetical protein
MKTGDIRFNDIKSDNDVVQFTKGLYIRWIVNDVDSFREKILLSDYNFDDRIVGLVKLSISRLISKETHTPVYRIFLDDASGNMLNYIAIMGTRAPFEYMNIASEVRFYVQNRDRYPDKLGRPESDEYILTNQKWAIKCGLLEDDEPDESCVFLLR